MEKSVWKVEGLVFIVQGTLILYSRRKQNQSSSMVETSKNQATTFESYRFCDIGVVWRSTKGFTKKYETINLSNMRP